MATVQDMPSAQLHVVTDAEARAHGSILHDLFVPGIWVGLCAVAVVLAAHSRTAMALAALVVTVSVLYEYAKLLDRGIVLGKRWSLMSPFAIELLLIIAFAFSFMPLAQQGGAPILVLLFGCTLIADVAAFFGGRALGRKYLGKHGLAGAVSPNKTREGVVCAWLAALMVAVPIKLAAGLPFSWWQLLIVALLMTSIGICGDLSESWLKRTVHVKDSGTWLRGMGGIFDRCDNLLIATPAMYVLLALHLR